MGGTQHRANINAGLGVDQTDSAEAAHLRKSIWRYFTNGSLCECHGHSSLPNATSYSLGPKHRTVVSGYSFTHGFQSGKRLSEPSAATCAARLWRGIAHSRSSRRVASLVGPP